jgi:hypothetical protein
MKNRILISAVVAGVIGVLLYESLPEKRTRPTFLVVEGAIGGDQLSKMIDSLKRGERNTSLSIRNNFEFADKSVLWASNEVRSEEELEKKIEMPDFSGSPVAFLRALDSKSGVSIRTYGPLVQIAGPSLRLPFSGLDFDSTVDIPGKTGSVRELIASCIPCSYSTHAINVIKENGAYTIRFVGMPPDLLENPPQRLAEGNPSRSQMMEGNVASYAEKYSYPNFLTVPSK